MNIFYLIIIITGLIGVTGKIVLKEKFNPKSESIFHRFYLFGYFGIFVFIADLNSNYTYFMDISEDMRIDNEIPYITKDLALSYRRSNEETWLNKNRAEMEICHYMKEIKLDVLGIKKETDIFINRSEDKTLYIINQLPSFVRKKKCEHLLIDKVKTIGSLFDAEKHALTRQQSDSILFAWGFNLEDIYIKKK